MRLPWQKRKLGLLAFVALLALIASAEAASVGWSAASKWRLYDVQPNRLYDVGQGYAYNPGDSPQCYVMDVGYIYNQPEKRPPEGWLRFSPGEFCLEGGQGVLVDIDLYVDPAIKIDGGLKGDYFAFIGPCTASEAGVSIGACAASRLYFTVGK